MTTAHTKPWLRDEKHGNWKGDGAGYVALHAWVRVRRGTPTQCEMCPENRNDTKYFDWSNISGEYKRDLSDWQRLCKKCHAKFDDLGKRAAETRKKNRTHDIAQLNMSLELVARHASISDASRTTGIKRTNICNSLSGLNSSAGGYVWGRLPV